MAKKEIFRKATKDVLLSKNSRNLVGRTFGAQLVDFCRVALLGDSDLLSELVVKVEPKYHPLLLLEELEEKAELELRSSYKLVI